MFDPSLQNNYETLPDLLEDLSTLASNCSKKWNATIDCGGDFHNLSFKNYNNGFCLSPVIDKNTEPIKNTYESMEALMAELEHIKQYMSAHEDDLGQVDLTYEVFGNGSKPFLKMTCVAQKPVDLDVDFNDCSRPIYYDGYTSKMILPLLIQGITIVGISFLASAPIMLLSKYLDIYNH